jgi:two-component system, LuxR family, sensor histidine kinase DctS
MSVPPFADRKVAVPPWWFWAVPKIVVGLSLLAVGTLLWLSYRNSVEEQRRNLISDILWAEQNLRFHLQGNQQALNNLALDIAQGKLGAGDFAVRATNLLSATPELVRLVRLDARGKIQAVHPALPGADLALPAGAQFAEASRTARLMGRPAYSEVYGAIPGEKWFEVHVALSGEGDRKGELVGIYSLNGLVQNLVPWWYAQQYHLTVLDVEGRVLAAKSAVDVDHPSPYLTYQIPFDPPGHGLVLRATAYQPATSLTRDLLIGTIVLLSAAMVWSLTALRRHFRERLGAEEKLRAEYAFRNAMEESMTTGMRARDLQGRIIYVNPAFCRMTGYSAAELIGQGSPHQYWAPEAADAIRAAWNRILAGDCPAEGFELRFMRKNGERFDVLIHEAPLVDANGKQTGWMGAILDITDRKRSEEMERQQREQLQLTSRLVTMGEMASTLAHELNQPLSAINGYVTGSLNRVREGGYTQDELRTALESTANQANRAGRIIARVHEFVRRRSPTLSPCDINRVVEEALAFLELEARNLGATVITDLKPGLPELLADTVMLEQVVLNLAKNGLAAMSGTPQPQRELRVITSVTDDGQAEVQVIDRGCGVSSEVAAKLFSPFFTTKDAGMGMGLNICRSIIEFHRGRLWHEANPRGGSIFRFTLPMNPL